MNTRDSTKHVLAVQLEAQRRLTPAARLKTAIAMSNMARALAVAGITRRNPALDCDGIRRETIRCLYGIEIGA